MTGPLAIAPYAWLDYCDHWFERPGPGIPVWPRNTRGDFPGRREQFAILRAEGFRVPPFGTLGEVRQRGANAGPPPRLEVVVYEDESLHQGEGKRRLRLRDAARAPYPDETLWATFVKTPSGRGESVRYLRVGRFGFTIAYQSDDWRSNVRTNDIELLALDVLNDAADAAMTRLMGRYRSPIFAVDLVPDEDGRLWATDLNLAPGLRGTGIEEHLPARDCSDEIKRAWYELNAPDAAPPWPGPAP